MATLMIAYPLTSCASRAREASVDPKVNAELAALMNDAPLPAAMMPAPMPAAPSRFCGFSNPPFDDDGGVSIGTGGFGGGIGGKGFGSGGVGGGFGTGGRFVVSDDAAIEMPLPEPGGPMGTGGAGVPPSMGGRSGGTAGFVGGTGGFGGVAGIGGGSNGNGDCHPLPIGFWTFDDCNATRTDLADSSFQRHSAFRNVATACAAGQDNGQAIAFTTKDDLVYAPDQPDFGLTQGITLAAWVKPDKVDGVRTLLRKRDDATSAVALVINNGKFQFVIRLSSGRLVSVNAPAKAGVWTHVAGTYDGTTLRLYINGIESKRANASGTIAKGTGPLLMGNDGSGRRLSGLLDNVWFNTLAAPDSTIASLTCLHFPAELSVEPTVSPAVPAGTTITYLLSIKNRNSASCPPASFSVDLSIPVELSSNRFFDSTQIASGATASIAFDISSGEETEPGTYPLTFFLFNGRFPGDGMISNPNQVEAEYVVAEPTGCHVTSTRELTIRDVSVVDDPIRTSMLGGSGDSRVGAWSFGRLMQRLSPSDAAAPEITRAMFASFATQQIVNSFAIEARPAINSIVLSPWPKTADGKLDLARAPMRLLAIVNRLDLKDLAKGKAGEGRMVYGVLDSDGNPLEFTVIFEYLLPAKDEAEFRVWANRFHALQALPFPSEEYNAALQAITDQFSARGALPGTPNGSALIDIRTNEIALTNFVWQLREFHLADDGSAMSPATIFLTPDSSFNGSERLGRFINANEGSIVEERHEVPLLFEGEPFLGGSVFNNIDTWSAPGIINPEARHKFSLNTCNGCHGGETQTAFLQIQPRFPGERSFVAGFQTGIDVEDPETGQLRHFNELGRRCGLLEAVVCSPDSP